MYENNLDTATVYCEEEMKTKVFIGHDCTSELKISLTICAEAWESNPMINTAHSDAADWNCYFDDNDNEGIYVCTVKMYGHSKLGLCFDNPTENENWQPVKVTGFDFFNYGE
jgi:hypothetical protein